MIGKIQEPRSQEPNKFQISRSKQIPKSKMQYGFPDWRMDVLLCPYYFSNIEKGKAIR